MESAKADWKQFLTWSLAFFNGAVTAFIGSERLRGPGGSMSSVSTGLLVVSAALLTASLVFSVLFIVQHPGVKYWRYWTAPLAVAAAALAGFRFYRDLTSFGQGVLLGVGGLLLLEGVRRLVVGYYLRKKTRRERDKAAEEAQRESERAAAEAARVPAPRIRKANPSAADMQAHAQGIAQKIIDARESTAQFYSDLGILRAELKKRGVDMSNLPESTLEKILLAYVDGPWEENKKIT